MLFFRQIERFLGKEIYKEKMPEEFGETPAYHSSPRSKGHGGKGRYRGKGRGKPHHNKKKEQN
jgi:hypothetical protein